MSEDFNRVILMGRIGNDLELKNSASGNPYLKVSLATHSVRANGKEGTEKTTHWHKVVLFGQQATLCAKYLRKGSSMLVEGTLETRSYENKEGHYVKDVTIKASRIQFLGGRMTAEVEKEGPLTVEEERGLNEDRALAVH